MDERASILQGRNLDGVCAAVGRTPLLHLRGLSRRLGCELLAKAEFMNPGGSIKDRAALGMILDAEQRGVLAPGGVIIEGTAGNTGIGLTLIGRSRGYRMIAILPSGIAEEKVALLAAVGAEVRTTPCVPAGDPRHYAAVAERLAAETPGGWWPNQFDNTANRRIHRETTGPEIWDQTGGRIDGFVAAVGSGGTLAGVSIFLKSVHPGVVTACADPAGASMYSWIKHKAPAASCGESVAEGIGQNRVTRNIGDAPVDDAFQVCDRDAVAMQHLLLREEGLFVGLSAAVNVCGAVCLARRLGRGSRVATVLCDGGGRYVSRLFNAAWLAERGLLPTGDDRFIEGLA
jgi:cysteine synthase A